MEEQDKAFETRSRELFADSVANLDGATRSRLAQARHAALAATQEPALYARSRFWAPALGAAMAVVLAVVMWQRAPNSASPVAKDAATAFEDIDIVASNEDMDLLEDDVDFYRWIDEAPDSGNGSVG